MIFSPFLYVFVAIKLYHKRRKISYINRKKSAVYAYLEYFTIGYENAKEEEPEKELPAKQQEGIRNAENIGDLENAVIINNEAVEKAPEKKENEIGDIDLDHVVIVDDETGEVIEEIGIDKKLEENEPEVKAQPEPVQPKAEDYIIEKAEPEIKVQPVTEEKQPEAQKRKTPEQEKYEKFLLEEKNAVRDKLSSEFIKAGLEQKGEQKNFAVGHREPELQKQPRMEMGAMKKK